MNYDNKFCFVCHKEIKKMYFSIVVDMENDSFREIRNFHLQNWLIKICTPCFKEAAPYDVIDYFKQYTENQW